MRNSNWNRFFVCAVIGTVSFLPLLVLPAMVNVLVDEAGLSESLAGWAASVNFFGVAVVALAMAFQMHRVDLRQTAIVVLSIALSADLASAYFAAPTAAFLSIRLIAGLANGAAQIAAQSAIARADDAERGFGLLITLQFSIAALGCYILPVYSAELGATGMFLLFAACDSLALLLAGRLPGRESDEPVETEFGSEKHILFSSVTLLALLGYFVFEAANTAQYTYLGRLGVALAFSGEAIGAVLMIASLAGIPGAFTIIVIGNRFGTIGPLLFGIGVAIVGLVILITSGAFAWYLMAGICLGFSWAFCLPFIQSLLASLDRNGSALAAGAAAAAIGVAVGPGLAASVVE
ncbi:MAG: MFS transporter, partial [Deltaproteobacteria bacterium]|nr:MFS transporter [Deltaproteobacteria bacterium]